MSPEEYKREDIEVLNEVRPYCFESDREEQWFKVGLQYGLDAADAEPFTRWISVKDDLPCNHEDLLIRDNKGYPQTKRVIVRYIEETLRGEKYVRHVCSKMSPWDGTGKFRWHMGDECITHWMRIPELPKE